MFFLLQFEPETNAQFGHQKVGFVADEASDEFEEAGDEDEVGEPSPASMLELKFEDTKEEEIEYAGSSTDSGDSQGKWGHSGNEVFEDSDLDPFFALNQFEYQGGEDRKKFQCRFCRASFANNYNLERHYKDTHSSDRPHKCQLCPDNKGFFRKVR